QRLRNHQLGHRRRRAEVKAYTRALAGLLAAASAARAQDARLAPRLHKTPSGAVNAIVDSARVAKLPTALLVDKALEGAAKGSDGQTIVLAVHQLSVRMTSARRVLGTTSSADEIKAAVTALDAGVPARDLERVK